MENYFYYYGIIYILHRFFIIGRGLYNRNKANSFDEVDITDSAQMHGAISKAVNPAEATLWCLNTLWIIIGFWTPESFLFVFILALTAIHIYYSMEEKTKHKAFYFSHIIKIFTVAVIIVTHLKIV